MSEIWGSTWSLNACNGKIGARGSSCPNSCPAAPISSGSTPTAMLDPTWSSLQRMGTWNSDSVHSGQHQPQGLGRHRTKGPAAAFARQCTDARWPLHRCHTEAIACRLRRTGYNHEGKFARLGTSQRPGITAAWHACRHHPGRRPNCSTSRLDPAANASHRTRTSWFHRTPPPAHQRRPSGCNQPAAYCRWCCAKPMAPRPLLDYATPGVLRLHTPRSVWTTRPL